MYQKVYSLQDLFAKLAADGYVTATQAETLLQTTSELTPAQSQTPWYIKVLVGIAAWLAAFFFISFLAVAEIVTDEIGAIVVGSIFCIIAVTIKLFKRKSVFSNQLAFALSLAGQIMLVGGIGVAADSISMAALAAILLEIMLLALYPDTFHRFLSGLAICGALLALLIDQELVDGIHLLIFAIALGAGWTWQQEISIRTSRFADFFAPLSYSLPVALFGICTLSLLSILEEPTHWWFSTVGLMLVFVYLGYQILSEMEYSLISTVGFWFVGSTLLLLIPAIQTPGILAAFIGLLLGFWRNSRLLMGIATLFLATFIFAYYYNLEMALLNKSFALMGTGVVLLGIHVILRFSNLRSN